MGLVKKPKDTRAWAGLLAKNGDSDTVRFYKIYLYLTTFLNFSYSILNL